MFLFKEHQDKFIGVDLRDINFYSPVYLTQMKINSVKGEVKIALPSHIHRPSHWIN